MGIRWLDGQGITCGLRFPADPMDVTKRVVLRIGLDMEVSDGSEQSALMEYATEHFLQGYLRTHAVARIQVMWCSHVLRNRVY